jgi:hypothetical protein
MGPPPTWIPLKASKALWMMSDSAHFCTGPSILSPAH